MESYLIEKEKLKKEYRECFERVEAYSLLKNVDEKTEEEMMMNLVDVLYTAQRKGKPLEKIVGKDVEEFCKNYFSEYHSVIQWVKGFPKWIYRISCFELRTRYRKYGTLKKPVEPGSAKAVYQANMEKMIEQWPVELQKNFERKNKKLIKKGKPELTIEKYMKKLQKECQMVKICDWIMRLFMFGMLAIPVVFFWTDGGFSDAVGGGVILFAIYYGIYKIFMNNDIYEAQENYLKQCEKEGITILELAERVKEANREECE